MYLFGTTAPGEANGDGTSFDMPSVHGSDAGTPTSFIGTDGAYPDDGPTAGANGCVLGRH